MRCAALLPVLVSFSAFGQQVTCTADVPADTCKFATDSFEFWEPLLIYKVPIVIADPGVFERELKNLTFTVNRFGLARDATAQTYSRSMLLERDKGNPCPVRVVISIDEFRSLDEKTFKRTAMTDLNKIGSTAEYIGGFLAGCESSLDY